MMTLGIETIKAEIIRFKIPMTKPNKTTRQNLKKVKSNPSEMASPNPFLEEKIDIKVSPKTADIVKLMPYCTIIPSSGMKDIITERAR